MIVINKLGEYFYRLNVVFRGTINYWIFRLYVRVILKFIRRDNNREALPGDNTISTKWLTILLRRHNAISNDDNIVGITFHELIHNTGLVGVVDIIKIEYDKQKSSSNRPLSLILKRPKLDFRSRCVCIATGQFRESLFYEAFCKNDDFKHLLPKIYYTYASKLTGCYLIIMENLCDNNYNEHTIGCNYYFNSEISTHLSIQNKESVENYNKISLLNLIFENAAKIHAKYWNDKALLTHKYGWLKRVDYYMNKNRGSWQYRINNRYNSWKRGKLLNKDKIKWSSKLVDIIDNSYLNASWSKFQARLTNPNIPFTLTHGDFISTNMFFNAKLNRLVWIDWSEVGIWEPMADIGLFILLNLTVKTRRANEYKLIYNYYNKLITCGVDPNKYTLKTCLDYYKRSTIERCIFIFSVLSSSNVPSNRIQHFHDQLIEFIDDHDSNQQEFFIY